MTISKAVHLVGYASGIAGPDPKCGDGPLVMKKSPYLSALAKKNIALTWEEMIAPPKDFSHTTKLSVIAQCCEKLAKAVADIAKRKEFFTVFGGDHSSAIGTWSGAYHAIKSQGSMGLIWIDAHMDSHTPHTSRSGNIHGMPLACLLGHGMPSLTTILENDPKIKPEHVCLIGVRSFERGEAALLKELNVRIFFMEEVRQRGLAAVMQEALEIVTKNTAGFGVTIDIDSIDPMDAPGTGTREPYGIAAKDLCSALQLVAAQSGLLGCEIVEFDPALDQDHKTEKLIPHLLAALVLGNQYHDASKSCCIDAAAVPV